MARGSSTPLARLMSEAKLMAQIERVCHLLGLLAYHTHDSRRSAPGYPDWHIVGRNGSLFRECKTERGRLTTAQKQWLAQLRQAGHDADVWRPRDWYSGRIYAELIALAHARRGGGTERALD